MQLFQHLAFFCVLLWLADSLCYNTFVSVKNKFGYAFPQEYPYRIQNVLECEFFLLEMMVSESNILWIKTGLFPGRTWWGLRSKEVGREEDYT